MTIIKRNGVSLSAGAAVNGFPLLQRVHLRPGMGDFADRAEGRARRLERRNVRGAKRSFLEG